MCRQSNFDRRAEKENKQIDSAISTLEGNAHLLPPSKVLVN